MHENPITCNRLSYSLHKEQSKTSQFIQLTRDAQYLLVFSDTKLKMEIPIRDITGIQFGGHSSNFWKMRKHINTMNRANLSHLPFFAWNCLTIHLESKDLSLVIKDDQQMLYVLTFLIKAIRTVDGKKGSADIIVNELLDQRIKLIKLRIKSMPLSKEKMRIRE